MLPCLINITELLYKLQGDGGIRLLHNNVRNFSIGECAPLVGYNKNNAQLYIKMNIYVGNLPYSATDSELRDLFGQFGAVSKTNVISDRDTGRSKGFGFVEMENDTEAHAAIAALHESSFEGRDIIVKIAEDRPKRNTRY